MWNRKLIISQYLFVFLVLIVSNRIGLSAEGRNEPISVVHCPNQKVTLEARWQWAMEQISKQSVKKPVWIGYSTERLMSEHSFIGRWPVDPDYPTLSELIYDVRVELPERSHSGYRTAHKVIKEVADLFEVDRASKSIGRIRTSNISLTVYMKRSVFFWLGKAGHEQSFSLLKKLYDEADDEHLKMRLVGRIGNTDHPRAISFLDEVLQKDKSARVRKEAVDELDAYHSREALAILVRTARNDPSDAVRCEAVDGISDIELSAAEDALIEIAKTGPSPGVRREAIDKLRDISTAQAMDCLVSIIDKQDEVYKLRLEALEALTDIENDGVLDALIKIAGTHTDPRLREEAIDQLDDIDAIELDIPPQVIQCLQSVINNPNEIEKVQWTALDQLADFETKEALNTLIRIAQTHDNPRIRLEAIDQLSDWDSSEVMDCLNRIVNKQDELYKIQEEALERLADIEEDRALDLLIQIVKTHTHPRIRREGINKLRDIDELRLSAFPKAIDCLVLVVNNKDELEQNRLEALEGLADIENNRAMDELIRVAGNHTHSRVREEALEHLSDMDELRLNNAPKVIKCFESIIDNPAEQEKIQRRALDALKEIEHQDVRTYITKVARSHPKQKVRKEAQEIVAEWIRDS